MRVLLSAIMVAVVVPSAQAVVLCAKPKSDGSFNTSVKIRTACKPGETQLDAGTLGLQGPPGPPGSQGSPGSPGVFVVDANNTVVGTVLGLADTWLTTSAEIFPILTANATPAYVADGFRRLLVVRSVNGSPAAFMVTREEVRSPSGKGALFFESTDCSGPPMVGSEWESGILIPYGFVRNGTAYAPRLGAAPIPYASQLVWDNSGPDCAANGGTFSPSTGECCIPRSDYLATPADTAPFPTFVPPFHVEG